MRLVLKGKGHLGVGSEDEFIMGVDIRGRSHGRSIIVRAHEEETIGNSPNSK